MAIDIFLYMGNQESPKKAEDFLVSLGDFKPGVDAIVGPDLLVFSGKSNSSTIVEEFGLMTPVSFLNFNVQRVESPLSTTYSTIVETSLSILDQLSSDGVLLFNGDVPLFVLRDGDLVVNKNAPFWNEEIMSFINRDYVSRPMDSF